MAGIGKKGNFAELVAKGENPNGVRTEGAFGVSKGGIGQDYYVEPDWRMGIAGPRWGGPTEGPGPIFPIMEGADSGTDLSGSKLKGGR